MRTTASTQIPNHNEKGTELPARGGTEQDAVSIPDKKAGAPRIPLSNQTGFRLQVAHLPLIWESVLHSAFVMSFSSIPATSSWASNISEQSTSPPADSALQAHSWYVSHSLAAYTWIKEAGGMQQFPWVCSFFFNFALAWSIHHWSLWIQWFSYSTGSPNLSSFLESLPDSRES